MEEKDFGRIIKERLENHEIQPSKQVWDKINQQLDVPMVAPKAFPWKLAIWIGSAIVLVAALTTVWLMQSSTKEETKHSETVVPHTQGISSTDNTVNTGLKESSRQTADIPQKETTSELPAKPVQKNQPNTTINTPQTADKTFPVSSIKESQFSDNNSVKSNNANINVSVPESAKPATNTIAAKKTIADGKVPVIKGTTPVNVELTGKTTICKGEEAKLDAKGGTSYLWSTYETTSSITVKPEETTTYSVVITPENGTEIEKQITVTVNECEKLIVPNAFTPGSDRNNLFKIYAQGISNFEIVIMSRQGQQVFISKDVNFSWDGTYKNEQLAAGVYSYIISYKDPNGQPKRKPGSITLIR